MFKIESGERAPLAPQLDGVSVVIPTLDRAEVLVDTVKDLLAQDFECYELIVVDQSERINEAVVELLKKSNVTARYFKAENFKGLPQARNYGWRQARFEIVLYIDDDVRATSEFVRAHYDAHKRTEAAIIAGGIDEAKGDLPSSRVPGSFNWWTATPYRNFSVNRPGWCEHAPGGNFSVKRAVLVECGGIDEVLSIGAALYEESELALRLGSRGYSTWFEPAARLTHLAAPMGGCRVQRDWPRYMFGLSHNRAILIFRHLKPWHRPTAILRILLLGLSYSRFSKSLRPMIATFRGLLAGREAAKSPPLNVDLMASECITY
ncbi:glycosyltransferase family 2 protein [Marinobacter qingdaonensis]|uniref:Glycosyltransferase n=1 Tax=Marinobacter qingdaonensis TaxID=3108486 RepID=A0ABU5P059_9GAMM|nr:glycosyltransferase [Marinobacter sp. ASW11-75]MEA1081435.1 glycosyltransferase [Marinobacter sp. ASW11-75]